LTNTPSGLYFPPLSNAPNVPSDMQQLALSADTKVIGNFATAAARAAAITTPVIGQITYRADAAIYEEWNGSAWVSVLPAGAWTSYTPTLTAGTTNPTLGTASVQAGQYVQIGKLIIGDAYVAFGSSGAAAGSGAYFISLPLAAAVPSPQTAFEIGSFSLSCAGLATRGFALLQSASAVNLRYTSAAINGTLTTVTNAAPGVWTNNDNIRVHFAYQAA
jgi:hypothetical protein